MPGKQNWESWAAAGTVENDGGCDGVWHEAWWHVSRWAGPGVTEVDTPSLG